MSNLTPLSVEETALQAFVRDQEKVRAWYEVSERLHKRVHHNGATRIECQLCVALALFADREATLAAVRADEIAAEAMGVNTTRCKVLAFVISAALAGVAGGLSGQLFANPLNPHNLNFVKSIEVIVMIVLGGIGSITGAVFGATTLTILPEALRTFDQQFPGLRMVLYALLLILLMIFRPQGLFGRRELEWSRLRLPNRRPAVNGSVR